MYYKIKFPLNAKFNDNYSQGFGKPHPSTEQFYKELGLDGHNGIDWACSVGTPVYAAHDGIIENTGNETGGFGVWLRDRTNQKIATLYWHLSKYNKKDGDIVKAGDCIAFSGNSGKYTTGPHLHFGLYELTRSGQAIKNTNNGYNGAIDPAPHLAIKFGDGTLIKNTMETKVYYIWNGYKWWLKNEESYLKFMRHKIGGQEIYIVDNITLNFYEYAGQIGK